MKNLIFIILGVFLINQNLLAQENSANQTVMRMVCLKTTSGINEAASYTGKVFVIEQASTEEYDGTDFVDPNARLIGRVPHTTNDTAFNIRVFPQVNNLDQVTSFQDLGNELLAGASDSTNPIIHATGYRANMRGDRSYSFFWDSPTRGMIQHYVENPTATGYQDGDDGGKMECQPPYTVAANSPLSIQNEETVGEEVLASYTSQ